MRYLDVMPELGYLEGDEDLLAEAAEGSGEEIYGRGNQEALVRGNRAGGQDALRSGREVPVVLGAVRNNNGLCTVHVDVETIDVGEAVSADANHKIQLRVNWSSSGFGGNCLVDASGGAQFTVGGADTVNIYAQVVSTVLDVNGVLEELVAPNGWRVEATCHWGASVKIPALQTLPSVRLNGVGPAPGVGPFQTIPKQARSFMVLLDDSTAYATLEVLMARNDTAGAATKNIARILDPFTSSIPVVAGAQVIQLDNPGVTCIATPVFELWI